MILVLLLLSGWFAAPKSLSGDEVFLPADLGEVAGGLGLLSGCNSGHSTLVASSAVP